MSPSFTFTSSPIWPWRPMKNTWEEKIRSLAIKTELERCSYLMYAKYLKYAHFGSLACLWCRNPVKIKVWGLAVIAFPHRQLEAKSCDGGGEFEMNSKFSRYCRVYFLICERGNRASAAEKITWILSSRWRYRDPGLYLGLFPVTSSWLTHWVKILADWMNSGGMMLLLIISFLSLSGIRRYGLCYRWKGQC